MTDQAEIPRGTVVAGRYRIERRLGQGGMGSVYEVEHEVTGQHLALKVLDPKLTGDSVALERFRRESRAPARIDSDHVVKVTDADVAAELKGAPFLVMELLKGESLDALLRRRGTLPPREVLGYLRQVGRALDRAHAIGIVHRDIKPENLFLTTREDGSTHVKLLDFGIAKLTEAHGTVQSKTATGEVFGTPLYMSPEQTLGRTDEIAPQTDVWALGIIAHKMLLGQEPWTAQTLPHLIAQIAYEPLPIPSGNGSELGPPFDNWFARCCHRQPKERFASAGEAVRALASALGVPERTLSAEYPVYSEDSRPGRSDAALAATAQAGSLPSVGSDTLTAQVAPGKPRSRFVLAASVGGVFAVLAITVVALRASSGPSSGAPADVTASSGSKMVAMEPPSEPSSAPSDTVLVVPTDPADAEPPASAKPPATDPEPPVSKRSPAVMAPRPPQKPTPPKPPPPKASAPVAPQPSPSPSPAPAPTPTDPLGGRH